MESCSICLELINEEELITTSCNHIFHQLCIDEWLSKKNTCPCCRSSILDIEYDSDDDIIPPLEDNNILHNAYIIPYYIENNNLLYNNSLEPFLYSINVINYTPPLSEYNNINTLPNNNIEDSREDDEDNIPELIPIDNILQPVESS
jgi:hypothetical protein